MLRTTMRTLAIVPILTLSLGVVGCAEKEGVKEETKITAPGGSEKITKETKVERSGENPPSTTTPVTPPAK